MEKDYDFEESKAGSMGGLERGKERKKLCNFIIISRKKLF